MLTPTSIVRFATQERYSHLLEALISNGQHFAPALRPGLSASPVPALAMGIKRIVELDRKPWPACQPLTQALLALQSDDGSFGQDPLATALATAALGVLLRQQNMDDPGLEVAHHQAVEALAAMKEDDCGWGVPASGLIHPSHAPLVNAFILQLLARDPFARQVLGLDQLLAWMDKHPAYQHRETQSCLRIARACLLRPVAA